MSSTAALLPRVRGPGVSGCWGRPSGSRDYSAGSSPVRRKAPPDVTHASPCGEGPPWSSASATANGRPCAHPGGLVHKVYDSILDAVGDTPLVKLHKVTTGLKCNVYVKVEYVNPGGSVKDRIAMHIIDMAEKRGELKPGGTIIEGTSGNTGAGLAMVAALRGYKTIFVLPDKQSEEKRAALRAWGARVVVTPTNVEPDDPRSYYSVAARLVKETPNSFYANQYHNQDNPDAHYHSTGPELYAQMDGKIDVFIAGLGTGGTITGTGKYLKEQNPGIQVVGVDPVGSLYYDYFHTGVMTQPHTYVVEGIGEDFLPSTCDFQYVDDVMRVNDKECYIMTRRLVREEGIFGGVSCGAAVAGALKYLRQHDREGMNVVILMPDNGSRYLSKVYNDKWMEEMGFLDPEPLLGTVGELRVARGPQQLLTVEASAKLSEVIGLMKMHSISQVPVVEGDKLVGMLHEKRLLEQALEARGKDPAVKDLVELTYCTVDDITEITVMTELFKRFKVAVVLDSDRKPVDIVTRIDLIDQISRVSGKGGGAA
ncbi:MAG: pyridoxal-phosphate dependent enzyme [Alphaproteobacteria bacterium]|nr:pyridoxal-phosphate dependent enzyme [Alphaproteobacteria bacterium]